VRVADRAGGAQARSLPNFNNPARLFPGTAGPSEPTLAAVPDGALLPSVTLFALPGQAAQAAPIGTDIAPPGRRPLPGQSEQQSTNAHLVDLAAGGYRPDRRRTWDVNERTFAQRHQATCAAVRACVRAFVRATVRARVRAGRGRWAAQCRFGPLGIGPGQPLFTLAGEARPRSRIGCSGLCGQCSSRRRAHRVLVVALELGHDGHRSKRIEADEQLHRLGDVDRSVPSNAHRASAGSAGRHVEANDQVAVLDGLVAGDVVDAVGDVEHGHCTCWSMLETSVRRPCAGCCTRMMSGAP
jgi:hypothetical protein